MRRGSETPRVYTKPLRELTPETSLGFMMCDFARDVCGVDLLPWQRWLAIHALELTPDGSFRFRVVLFLVARQNGKSTFGQVMTLFFLYVLGVRLVVGTAQDLGAAEEIWDGAIEMVEGVPDLSREVAAISRRNGNKALKLKGGRRYAIKAATRKAARSFSADLVLLDELREHTSWDAWGAVTKTEMARPNAMVLTMSNAGDGSSVVLNHLRAQAHAACGDPDGIADEAEAYASGDDGDEVADDSLGIFEWSAPPGCDKWDRDAWAQANPSLGYGFLTERALASACATDPDAVFRTECLCQRVKAMVEKPFPEGAWEAGVDARSSIPAEERLTFGLDMSYDRRMTSLAVCGRRADGLWHVEVIERRGGHAWAIDALRKLAEDGGATVAVQGRGATISSYLGEIEAIEGVTVARCEGRDLGAWCGRFYDAVCVGTGDEASDATQVMHRPQPVLDEAAQQAQKRALGDGAWAWDRRASNVDISPLVACTMAFGAASATDGEQQRASAYETHGLIVI